MKDNQKNNPTILIILGATGDLSKRKLIPAIFDLFIKGFLPDHFRIVGLSRQKMTDNQFRDFAEEIISKEKHRHTKKDISKFIKNIFYKDGMFEDAETYQSLAGKLIDIDKNFGLCSDKLFYLAVPPLFYEVIFQNLANSGLSISCSDSSGWTRVLVEKPFGRDLKTAQKLDKMLGLLFKEEQVFRIDHYLAKETVQNILSFRFSNTLFEPIWSNNYIEKVEIKLFETLGVEGRGEFYNDIGALRDVGQNHILQMLSLVAMESPHQLKAELVRRERAKVLNLLCPISGKNILKHTSRGQYSGYKKEKTVDSQSNTETYFKIKAYINNKRWEGMPFYLESGKKMKETKVEIAVYFKKAKCLCPPEIEQHHQNILIFRIQPNEGTSIQFWAKKPGFTMGLEPKNLSFLYNDNQNNFILPDAYERILFDCIRGNQILFASSEEVDAAWKFITPILKGWGKTKLVEYKEGWEGEK